jgi:hypothetical protein
MPLLIDGQCSAEHPLINCLRDEERLTFVRWSFFFYFSISANEVVKGHFHNIGKLYSSFK